MVISPEWFDAWFEKRFTEESYTTENLPEVLGISRRRIYEEIGFGTLEAIRVGYRWVIPRPAVKSWLLRRYSLNT